MSRFSLFFLFLLPLFVSASAIESSQQIPLNDDTVRTMDGWDWSYCGSPNDVVQIKSISVTPDPPKPGKDLTVTVVGSTYAEIVDGAVADVLVKLGLIKIFKKTFDLCEEARKANTTVQCPVEPGIFTIEHTAALPREIPQAKYSIDVNAFSADDEDLFCLKLDVNFIQPI